MATILRGKDKGGKIKLHQWCNNWVTSTNGKVFFLTSLLFTDEEIQDILNSFLKEQTGVMFDEFELVGNRFRRKKNEKEIDRRLYINRNDKTTSN